MGIRFACCFCNLEDSQHLEMLSVVVRTIVRSFLSWMNLFETVLETFEIVSKGFVELVHLFVNRLGLDPKFVGLSPK
jgi:hypothetical protein